LALPASQRHCRGILVGARSEALLVSNVKVYEFAVSCVVQDLTTKFSWNWVVVYEPAYEDRKVAFIDELHNIMASWQGPWLIGGDFNLSRFPSDKNTRRINQKFVDYFNDWVNKWGLIELNPPNRKFTWSNNQENAVLAKLDRILISTDWEATFPLVRVLALPKGTSDHNPLLIDSGENCSFSKK
jgi:hypothetical protein